MGFIDKEYVDEINTDSIVNLTVVYDNILAKLDPLFIYHQVNNKWPK
jgi:carboxyl-terminal processing protease